MIDRIVPDARHADDLARPAQANGAGGGGAAPAPPAVASLAGVVPEHLLDEGEIVILAVKPSLWFVLFYSAPVIAAIAVLLFLLLFVNRYVQQDLETVYLIASRLAAILIFLQLLVAFLQWTGRLYVLTNRRIMRIRGIFNINVFEAPLTRIQNTYLTFALHERVLGLGSIRFATAGTAGVDPSWTTINTPLEVHDIIRQTIRHAQSRPGASAGL